MGFQVLEGPKVELDEYNFQKLNIPDHPQPVICGIVYGSKGIN
ncbi:MAG: hypothetical protein CM1200mP3_13040 [Chloroflexota bacterium]|nr:MAG: hypothetical protein CM1200mP3_13040 [Chloroflexota bacterium]